MYLKEYICESVHNPYQFYWDKIQLEQMLFQSIFFTGGGEVKYVHDLFIVLTRLTFHMT